MNEIDKKRIQQKYEKYSDDALIEEALSPREDYQEGVYELITEICNKRGLEDKINQARSKIIEEKKEKERIESASPYDFYRLSAIQSKIQELLDEELIDALNHEKEELIREIIHEELFNRGIKEPHLLKRQYSQIQTIEINPFRIMKDGFQFFTMNPTMLFLGVIVLISDILFGINGNLKFLYSFIIPPLISGLIIKCITEIKTDNFSWKTTIKFVFNKSIYRREFYAASRATKTIKAQVQKN